MRGNPIPRIDVNKWIVLSWLDLIKNTDPRCTMAKLRSENHNLMTEYGRYRSENSRAYKIMSVILSDIEDEKIGWYSIALYTKTNGNHFFDSHFNLLNKNDVTLLLFNNIHEDRYARRHTPFKAFEKRTSLAEIYCYCHCDIFLP